MFRAARIGNQIIDVIEAFMIAVMFLYGGYCLWDNYRIEHRAFVDQELLQYKPTREDTQTLKELMEINEDVIGWISIDKTHIDYPMVQGEDDFEYLNKDVHGDFALSGSIFLSSENERDFSDPYSIIYGHHMDNGAMFGDVTKFTKKKYFDTHKKGTLYLPDRSYKIEIFAVVKTNASNNVLYNVHSDRETLLAHVEENAKHYRDIGQTSEDTIIGLSTCSESITNGRVILYGRLVDEKKVDNGGVKRQDEK